MLVIIFHTHALGVSGGFVGVDIFFVISGYLITRIIYGEMKEGQFSFLHFYERRIRRIFPALFAMLFVTTIVAGLLMMPLEFKGVGETLSATALFYSNILFWQQAGYFDTSGILKPFLHTWSITIEEQFYLLFPLYLLIVYKYMRPLLIPLTLLGMALSFALGLWTLSIGKDTATFYLLPTRAWQFLVGGILALGCIPNLKNAAFNNICSVLGLGLICAAAFFLLDNTSRFPGINALYPTIGAALLIYSAMHKETFVSKLLSLKPIVFIGKISYSLYLWHWPVIVFASYYMMRDPSEIEAIGLILFCLILSYFSWKFIEQPFRVRNKTYNRKALFGLSALAITLFASAGYYISKSDGIPSRFNDEILGLAYVHKGPQTELIKISGEPWVLKKIGDKTNEPSFLIIGDSHANAVSGGIHEVALSQNISGILIKQPGCIPTLDITPNELSAECSAFNKFTRNYMKDLNIDHIVLIARWSVYPKWISKTSVHGGNEQSRARTSQLLNQTIQTYQKKGIKVTLVSEVPRMPKTLAPSILGRNLYLHGERTDEKLTKKQHLEYQKFALPILESAARENGITLIHPYKTLCPNEYCDAVKDGKNLYYDDDHLSTYGAKSISSIYKHLF